ncbi:MAG: hypothetical protein Q9214_005523 [Letrouitia sp. 1 TL-2023]
MTPNKLVLLSLLASTASAVPSFHQRGYGHQHVHRHYHPSAEQPTGASITSPSLSSAPYGLGNSTLPGPTGTGTAPGSSSSPVVYSTVTVVPVPVPGPSGPSYSPIESSPASSDLGNSPIGGSSAVGDECGPATVTITSANTVTVTVGAGPASSYGPVESSAVELPTEASSAPYGNGTSSALPGTGTAPILSATSSVPVYTAVAPAPETPIESATSQAPAPLPSSHEESSPVDTSEGSAPPATTAPQTGGSSYDSPEAPPVPETHPIPAIPHETSAPSKTPSKPSSDNCPPRGLVYNDASMTSLFNSEAIGWQYNWDSAPGGTIDTSKEFVPMLWSTSMQYHVPHWKSRAEAAIAAGSTHLLGFNEPDLPAQANMNVGECVDGWLQYIEPFAKQYGGKVKLGSPSVCNGPDANQGLQFLGDFISQCSSCTVDFLSIHWYGLATDDGVQNLKDHIGKAQAIAGGRDIWLTEFKPDGSDEQQKNFLDKILPWLDDKSNGVARYAYFRVDNMVNGNSLSPVGQAYAGSA